MGGAHRLLGPVILVALGAVTTRSRADETMSLALDAHVRYLVRFPSVDVGGNAVPRTWTPSAVATGNSGSFAGIGFGWELVVGDRFRLPLLGASYDRAVGSNPRVVGSIDGSIVEVDTWRSALVTVLLPGLGFRAKKRRWMFEASVQPGVSLFLTSGNVVMAGNRSYVDYDQKTFTLRADVAVCRRLDPIDRVCAFVAPALYEFGSFNGGSIGLRWEPRSMTTRLHLGLLLIAAAGALGVGCFQGGELDQTGDHIVRRDAAVIVEGCTLDDEQLGTLAAPPTRTVLREVLFLCPAIGADGHVAPAGADREALTTAVARAHSLGYRVSLATTIGTAWNAPADVATLTTVLRDETARSTAGEQLAILAGETGTDGIDLALPQLGDRSRDALSAFVRTLSTSLRPAVTLGIFAPPSSQAPSDLPGGEAYDLTALAPTVDRVRLMTLDYSCCGAPLGPTTDPGWAVSVERLAQQQAPSRAPAVRFGVSYPLYGWDGTIGSDAAKPVTYGQAIALAAATHAPVQRGPTGAPYFEYAAADGRHQVWFDDTASTLRALHAWNDALAPTVDVVFYGLGAEDPTLWAALAGEMR